MTATKAWEQNRGTDGCDSDCSLDSCLEVCVHLKAPEDSMTDHAAHQITRG